jgi:hypothetical protein
MQVESIPACNSYQYHEGKCEKGTAAAPLMQVESIPACNSYQYHEGKCEKGTAAAPLMQVESIPACNSYQYHEGKCEKGSSAAPLMQVESIPACTSFECKKRDASQVIEAQVNSWSDPICSSAGCGFKAPKDPYPMDYFVPHFGEDPEIAASQAHEASARARLQALRNAGKAAADAARASAAPAKASAIQLESDPNCTSIECQIHHTMWKKEDDVVDYPISSAETLDDDLKFTQKNIASAEKALGKWDYKPAHAGYNFVDIGANVEWSKDWRQHRFHFANNY